MAVNKVVYDGRILIDLTGVTVTPDTLAEGVTAYDAAGRLIVGRAKFNGGGSDNKAICGEAVCGAVTCGAT